MIQYKIDMIQMCIFKKARIEEKSRLAVRIDIEDREIVFSDDTEYIKTQLKSLQLAAKSCS